MGGRGGAASGQPTLSASAWGAPLSARRHAGCRSLPCLARAPARALPAAVRSERSIRTSNMSATPSILSSSTTWAEVSHRALTGKTGSFGYMAPEVRGGGGGTAARGPEERGVKCAAGRPGSAAAQQNGGDSSAPRLPVAAPCCCCCCRPSCRPARRHHLSHTRTLQPTIGTLPTHTHARTERTRPSPGVRPPARTAPQVSRNQQYDAQADIFSLGMCMYNLFNRTIPTVQILLNGDESHLELYAAKVGGWRGDARVVAGWPGRLRGMLWPRLAGCWAGQLRLGSCGWRGGWVGGCMARA